NSIPTHKWLKTLYLILHIIQDLTVISTGKGMKSTGAWDINRKGDEIDRSVGISTGKGMKSTGAW
ncbi:hypothetical protein ACFQ1Y_13590, partial [Virgibacillus alimentarius]